MFYLKGEKRERKKASGGEKKERKKKLTKLPGQPKRAMSSYMIWMNANRDRIKNDNPGFSIGEIAKKAGEEWKAMSVEDKSVGLSNLLTRADMILINEFMDPWCIFYVES